MLTNVAIVVMRLVGLAPASVEQRNARRHASCVSRILALGNAHQSIDEQEQQDGGEANADQ